MNQWKLALLVPGIVLVVAGSLFSLLLHGLALGRLFLLLGSELGLSFLFMALLRRFASGRIFRLLVFFFCFGGFLFGQLCSSFTFFFLM